MDILLYEKSPDEYFLNNFVYAICLKTVNIASLEDFFVFCWDDILFNILVSRTL